MDGCIDNERDRHYDSHAENHAASLAESGHFDAALAILDTALAHYPHSATGHEARAQVLLEIGQDEDAVHAAVQAATLAPKWYAAQLTLARCARNTGRLALAQLSCREALACLDSHGLRLPAPPAPLPGCLAAVLAPTGCMAACNGPGATLHGAWPAAGGQQQQGQLQHPTLSSQEQLSSSLEVRHQQQQPQQGQEQGWQSSLEEVRNGPEDGYQQEQGQGQQGQGQWDEQQVQQVQQVQCGVCVEQSEVHAVREEVREELQEVSRLYRQHLVRLVGLPPHLHLEPVLGDAGSTPGSGPGCGSWDCALLLSWLLLHRAQHPAHCCCSLLLDPPCGQTAAKAYCEPTAWCSSQAAGRSDQSCDGAAAGLCGVRVLELGCGRGLVGLAAASLGALVTLTDRPDALQGAHATAAANAQVRPLVCTVRKLLTGYGPGTHFVYAHQPRHEEVDAALAAELDAAGLHVARVQAHGELWLEHLPSLVVFVIKVL